MGKGFENYMSKKWFHPTNVENMKRVFMAEQKSAGEKKRQQDLREQYEREQEVFSNKQLMGDEKSRLGLAFMYNAPAGYKESDKKDEATITVKQEEPKFEWQRKDNAPREELSKNNESNQDKGFSSEVRNKKCLKCKKWGHINTDKACPLYGKSKLDIDDDYKQMDSQVLAKGMAESEGLVLKSSLMPISKKNLASLNANIEEEYDEKEENIDIDLTLDMLRDLSKRDKKFFLKRLKKFRKFKTENKKRRDSSSDSSSSSSSSSESETERNKKKKKSRK